MNTNPTFTSSTTTAGWMLYLLTGRRSDPPPAGVRVPAPAPLPPGPLRWEARRLDQPDALEPSR